MGIVQKYGFYAVFILALTLNVSFWAHSKTVKEQWANVPSAPANPDYITLMALGDTQIAYRMVGYFLQNLGNTGGEARSFQDYDFAPLEKWLMVSNKLDPQANYVPYLASYYFGATQDPAQAAYLVDYLHQHGREDYPGNWRWFAQAVYLAQNTMKDDDLALKLATELSEKKGYVAPWARQLPAFINLKLGNKEVAYGLLLSMLKSEAETMPQAEVNAILDIICLRTLNKSEAAQNPLCQDLK